MAQPPSPSGSSQKEELYRAQGPLTIAANKGDDTVAAVACQRFAEAPELQLAGEAGRAPLSRELTDDLFEAATLGNVKRVAALLENGANPNAADKEGRTALIFAVIMKSPTTVEALLRGGANPNQADKKGRSAIQIAKDYDFNRESETKIWALLTRPEELKNQRDVNIKNQWDVNIVDKNDITSSALMGATLWADAEDARAHLDAGANPNAADEYGYTVLMMAAFGGHAEVVRALVERGADPDVVDKYGKTARSMVEMRMNETSRKIRALLSNAKELFEAKNQRDVAEQFATLVPGMGRSMLL